MTWFVADLIFSRRALYPEFSALSSFISATISSVVRELFSSFSSGSKLFPFSVKCTTAEFRALNQTRCKDQLCVVPASSCLQLWVRVCSSELTTEIWSSIAFRSDSFTSLNWSCVRLTAVKLNSRLQGFVHSSTLDYQTNLTGKVNFLLAIRFLLYLALHSQQLHGFDHSLIGIALIQSLSYIHTAQTPIIYGVNWSHRFAQSVLLLQITEDILCAVRSVLFI